MGKTATELRWEIDQRRADLTDDFEALGDRVSPSRMVERRTEAVRSSLRSARERVMGSADDVSSAAQDRAGAARGRVQDAAHTVTDTVSDVPDMVRTQTQGNPLAAGLVAFGLGLLAATVIPSSRRERELARQVQPQLEQAAQAVGASASGMVDELKPMVQDRAQELTGTAKEAAQHVVEEGKTAATDVAADAKQAAGNVADAR